jgi:glycosyltransferase involved in cell wall biosynthesis
MSSRGGHKVGAIGVSVIVPTRNECGNVVELVQRIDDALRGEDVEIIFADDSDDDTPTVIDLVVRERNGDGPVLLLHRPPARRAGGLGGAVVAALRRASGEFVCVIDGDLQHPPATITALLDRARQSDRPDLVVATRYAAGGASGLTGRRAVVSKASNALATRSFPSALRGVSDPMSGFFLFARSSVEPDVLRPNGFKILLDIAAHHPRLRVAEVGYRFGERAWGDSKASMQEGLKYARQLRELRREMRYAHEVGAHAYDIHGIVTVLSDARLPELEPFRVRRLFAEPTIRVRLGRLPRSAPRDDRRRPMRCNFRYREVVGNAGFAADVVVDGERVDVLAAPLLRRSPHVLYTNLVEPILRWTLVKRGSALAHGAVFVDEDRAYMVTALTDTGKTTTMLKLLDAHPELEFMADDLSIIQPDGTILCFPKPMTISQHTVHAVHTPNLGPIERATLGLQSRLHSREGRRFAFLLARTGLPVATVNMVVQLIVPPPKYPVGRLVPGVPTVPSARFSGLFVIVRGERNATQSLTPDDALETLLANTDDAYGFPPYHTLEEFMLASTGEDLRAIERQIIGAAIEGAPASVLESTTLDWAERIPSLIEAHDADIVDLTERTASADGASERDTFEGVRTARD